MFTYLENPIREKSCEVGENHRLEYAACSVQGWRVTMEDSHISEANFDIDRNISLFAVFDGHGGAEVALFWKQYFGAVLKQRPEYKDEDYEEALRQAFLDMDVLLSSPKGKQKLMSYLEPGEIDSTAGCTAIAVLIDKDNILYIANAGDSRAIAYTNNEVIKLSEDHKPMDAVEQNRIFKAGGYITAGRINGNLNLSRAIGDLEYKKNPKMIPEEQMITAFPDVLTYTITDSVSFILLGCDGLWEINSDDDIWSFVHRINQLRKNNLPFFENDENDLYKHHSSKFSARKDKHKNSLKPYNPVPVVHPGDESIIDIDNLNDNSKLIQENSDGIESDKEINDSANNIDENATKDIIDDEKIDSDEISHNDVSVKSVNGSKHLNTGSEISNLSQVLELLLDRSIAPTRNHITGMDNISSVIIVPKNKSV